MIAKRVYHDGVIEARVEFSGTEIRSYTSADMGRASEESHGVIANGSPTFVQEIRSLITKAKQRIDGQRAGEAVMATRQQQIETIFDE